MEDLPYLGARGERARLFPVLSEKSKEGRTLSAFLAVLAQVREFSDKVLRKVGQPVGVRAKLMAFSEVTFPKSSNPKLRPDGLVVLDTGKRVWTALIEAKIGAADLAQDQVEAYLSLAREVGADCVITISNDFTATHDSSPVNVNGRLLRKVELFHFSWFSLLTYLNVLSSSEEIEDNDHQFLLEEFERFLLHDSAGLKRYTQMDKAWGPILDQLRSGLNLTKSSDDVRSVVESWQAELRDLCFYLTRRTGELVVRKSPKRIANDASALFERDLTDLIENKTFAVTLEIPNAAALLNIEADLNTRTIRFSSELAAPQDKQRQTSRMNWILWQLPDENSSTTRIRSLWPGRAAPIETTVAEALDDNTLHSHPDKSMLPHKFVLMNQMTDGRKFAGRSTFVSELEDGALNFYEEVLSHLKAWVPPAPKVRPAIEEED